MRKVFVSFLILFSVLFMSCGSVSARYLSGTTYEEDKLTRYVYAVVSDPFKRFGITFTDWKNKYPDTKPAYFCSAGGSDYTCSEVEFMGRSALASVAYNAGYKYIALVNYKINNQSIKRAITANSFGTPITNVYDVNKFTVESDALLFNDQSKSNLIKDNFNFYEIIYTDDYALQAKKK